MGWWEFEDNLYCSDELIIELNKKLTICDYDFLLRFKKHIPIDLLDTLWKTPSFEDDVVSKEELLFLRDALSKLKKDFSSTFEIFLSRTITSKELAFLFEKRKNHFNQWLSYTSKEFSLEQDAIISMSSYDKDILKKSFYKHFEDSGLPKKKTSPSLYKRAFKRVFDKYAKKDIRRF